MKPGGRRGAAAGDPYYRGPADYLLHRHGIRAGGADSYGSGGYREKPVRAGLRRIGIPWAADIINFVILTAILSAANSGLYASGRMLWSLANENTLPRAFARVNKRGVPMLAITVSMVGGLLALVSSVVAPDTVFVALSAISGFAVVAVWLSICASHFVFPSPSSSAGQIAGQSGLRAPLYPLTPVLGFLLLPAGLCRVWR